MFNTKSKVAQLQEKSANIMNVFTSTVNSLRAINDEIVNQQKLKEEQIQALKEETAALENQRTSNDFTIAKVSSFLKED